MIIFIIKTVCLPCIIITTRAFGKSKGSFLSEEAGGAGAVAAVPGLVTAFERIMFLSSLVGGDISLYHEQTEQSCPWVFWISDFFILHSFLTPFEIIHLQGK